MNTAATGAPVVGPGQAAVVLISRELRLAWRRWGQSLHPVIFFLMVTTLFPLALSPESARLRLIAGGVVWVGALLSSLLALETLFRADHDDGTLEQLVLCGQPLAALMLAKTVAHWFLSGVPLVLATPVALAALAVPASAFGPVMLGILLGTGVLSFVGGIGAALTLGTRRGSVLLSLLVLPLAMPVLIFGARAADLAIRGEPFAGGLLLLTAMLVFTVTLAPIATAAAVRICLE